MSETVKATTVMSGVVNTPVLPAKVVLPVRPPQQPQRTTLAASVSGAQAQRKPGKGGHGNSNEMAGKMFFRCVLYSETSARKTTTAAEFAGPEFTRIILTRGEDQMIPLGGQGYKWYYAPDAESLTYALKNPELLWPDWAAMPDPENKRTIVVDDLTKAVGILIEANAGALDRRQAYTGALSDLDSLVIPLTRKPYNLILISLARVAENKMSGEERIGPDLSPSLLNYVTAEFAAVLYIKTKNYKLLTDRDVFSVEGTDDKGRTIMYSREIFGKIKVPKISLSNPALKINKEESMDLAVLWGKIKKAQQGAGK